jgi:hypothetical protein
MALPVPDYSALAYVIATNHRGADIAFTAGAASITHGRKWLRQIPIGNVTEASTLTLVATGMTQNHLWVIQRLDPAAFAVTIEDASSNTLATMPSGWTGSVLFRLDERGLEQVGSLAAL